MLTSLQRRMIILFMILYTTVASLINGTSPLTSTMNLLGYEPIKSNNSTTALKRVVTSLLKSTVKKKGPDIPPKQINYVTKHITSCPEVGYFFKRETPNSLEASQCYLCFCSDPKWAICWPRDNKRCDYEHYHHHGVGKRDVRTRRSPGFSDIFFRDASLDIFNKNTPEQCKPHESSFSEGCPPADWCIGCTVCDCDSNGRWDCHTLSFCPDQEVKNGKNKLENPSKKLLRKRKKKMYKDRGTENVTSTKMIISKRKTKATPKGSIESKTASKKSEKKVMAHKKGPQINQPVKKKFKKKKEYQMSDSKQVKKNTTQVVMMPSKKKREVKKNIKKTVIISKLGAKNNSTILKKNDSKKNNTIIKNKSTKIKSEKMVPTKNNQTMNSNLVKKQKPVTKDVTPKNTTEAKENLRQSLRQTPKKSPLSLSAKNTKQTKKPMAKKINSKDLKDISKEPKTNNKKLQPNKNKKKKHNPVDMKKKKNHKDKKNKSKSYHNNSNLTADIIKDIQAKGTNRKAHKHKKKQSLSTYKIKPDVMEGMSNMKRMKRHVTDTLVPPKSTKAIAVTKSVIEKETVTKPVTDIETKTNVRINSATYKPSETDVYNINGTGKSSFKHMNENVVGLLTEKNVTTKSPIHLNKTDFSTNLNIATIETTTSMEIEPTVSLSSYYMYSVDDAIRTTPELNKTKTFSVKRSLLETLNIKNISNTTKNMVFKDLDLAGTSIYTTESLNENSFNNITVQTAATLKYIEKSENTIQKSRFEDLQPMKSELTPRLEKGNITIQNLKDRRRKMYSSDITRKIGNPEKKYRLRKIVHVYSRNKTHLDETSSPNYQKKNITNKRLSSLQNFIRNHISLFSRRNSTRQSGTHNIKVMSYLKKFFKKILSKRKKNKSLLKNDTSSLTIDKNKFIKTLCETFGPCYMTEEKRLLLNSKIDDLTSETNKMFKTIKVLKGLLKLVNVDKNKIQNKDQKISKENKNCFTSDVRKLGSILRDSYVQEQKRNLTANEFTQITYVKRNMQLFAQSTASFAKILNEIIDTLTTPGNALGLIKKYSKMSKPKPEKQVETFQKLQNLLLSYKLLQNRFLQKMYEILGHVYPLQSDKNISADVKANKTATLHVYTKDIIKNLRKLKNLAQVALSKTMTHERKRRDIREEESVEYLLVLMEYLLKHSYQTDSVTDGLDLLIEAIKNAPDIKLIQKQALEKHLTEYNISNTQMVENVLVNNVKHNTVPEQKKISKEFNDTLKQDESQANNIDSLDNESDFEYLPVMDRRVNKEIAFTTTVNDYLTYNKEKTTEDTAILELSSAKSQTESSILQTSSSLKTILLDEYNKKFDRLMNVGEDDDFEKRMEIFSSDLDDEILTTSTKRPRHKVKYNRVMSETTKNTEENKHSVKETDVEDNLKNDLKDDMSLSTSESKSSSKYLDWLDETFEEEIKEVNNTEKVKPLLQTLPTQEIILRRRQDESNQIKDISLSDETYNTKKRDTELDDKMKEMNLLDSLDDNFGKSDSDGLDSKDTFELHTD